MQIHLMIEYERPARTDEERAQGYGNNPDRSDWLRCESLLGIPLSDDGTPSELMLEFLREYAKYAVHDPKAKLEFGGECFCRRPHAEIPTFSVPMADFVTEMGL